MTVPTPHVDKLEAQKIRLFCLPMTTFGFRSQAVPEQIRFNFKTDWKEFQEKPRGKIFPPNSPEGKRVQLILRRILEGLHSGLKIENEVRVYGDVPKYRKMYSQGVYSGQVGHGVAQHLSEKLMTSVWISALVGEFIGSLVEEIVERELEADYIGLMIMASAGYDPRVAPTFYKSLPEESYSSRHPSGSRRSEMLNRPEVHPGDQSKRVSSSQKYPKV
ncbi:hypothetical protein RJ639_006270 [Escallonia herrerae]|uniref:Peptidase M48 domain-containing protein n=1 Tax=Escallonia herrerae TaxID=1293975 RepID=A0AA88VWC3_9ASTE|nr:hypothetical protein RJ639_006270 [Escallonia herrerae]